MPTGFGRFTIHRSEQASSHMTETQDAQRVREILAKVKPLAVEFYKLTGKPLGVTGEIAEFVAAEILGLELAPPRTPGYDAVRKSNGTEERVQIKGRAFPARKNASQRLGRIKPGANCHVVLAVLLDAEFEAEQIWEASYADVCKRLAIQNKAHERGSLSVSEFKGIGHLIWPRKSD